MGWLCVGKVGSVEYAFGWPIDVSGLAIPFKRKELLTKNLGPGVYMPVLNFLVGSEAILGKIGVEAVVTLFCSARVSRQEDACPVRSQSND